MDTLSTTHEPQAIQPHEVAPTISASDDNLRAPITENPETSSLEGDSPPNKKHHYHRRGKQPHGAQSGNANAYKHGLRASVSKFPKAAKSDERKVYTLRNTIQEAVATQYGEISVMHAALIQSAVRHETRAILAARWLRRDENEKLPLNDRLQLLATISSATDARDKCLKALGLLAAPKPVDSDFWSSLDEPEEVSTNE